MTPSDEKKNGQPSKAGANPDLLLFEIRTLAAMISALPPELATPISDQLTIVLKAVRDTQLYSERLITTLLDDVRLEVKSLEFNLDCTRLERDQRR